MPPYGQTLLIAGTSGSGKSTLTTGLLERLDIARYAYAVIDPEGDYAGLPNAVVRGSPEHAPHPEEALNVLETGRNVVINLLGVPLADRPSAFDELLPRLLEYRRRKGAPHWVVIDEAHHLMPAEWAPESGRLPRSTGGLALITVHPGSVSPRVLNAVDVVLALGHDPAGTVAAFCSARGLPAPGPAESELRPGEALAYRPADGTAPFPLAWAAPHAERRRHSRKYAEGRLPDHRSFVFRGPAGKLKLRAHNLMSFLDLAEGVDDDTWLFHLKGREYSKWIREAIKDDDLARAVEEAEGRFPNDPAAGRAAVRKSVEQRYTLPAEGAD